jgi:DNA-binding response OmpR family regulator
MNQPARILIVEDERELCAFLKDWLQESGYEVECVYNGFMALARVKERPFHLVLTDIRMPGIDGLELLRCVKEANEDTVVIMMTAFSSLGYALKSVKYVADDYLTKPFIDKRDLLEAVERGLTGQGTISTGVHR